MAKIAYMSGVAALLQNLKQADAKMQSAAERGCIAGANLLRNESRRIVPVQTGNLKASAYPPRNIGGRGWRADIVVGYTAGDYAIYVHEIPNPPTTHGKEFNIKHAAEIAAAGKIVNGRWKPTSPMGTAQGGMFPRGEEQRFKYLEEPMRTKRREIIGIIAKYIRGVK